MMSNKRNRSAVAKKLAALVLLVTFTLVLSSCTGNVEKLPYEVLKKTGDIEIRKYDSYIIAETEVDSTFEEAGNVAFGRLYGYISGANKKKQVLADSPAPLNQSEVSEKIAMTAPVNQAQSDGKFLISFVMPEKYTMQTIPLPSEDNVIIREVPAGEAVAIIYSGLWSKKSYDAKEAKLNEYINANKLTP